MDLLLGGGSVSKATGRLAMHHIESGPADGVPVVLVHGNLSTGRLWPGVAPGTSGPLNETGPASAGPVSHTTHTHNTHTTLEEGDASRIGPAGVVLSRAREGGRSSDAVRCRTRPEAEHSSDSAGCRSQEHLDLVKERRP